MSDPLCTHCGQTIAYKKMELTAVGGSILCQQCGTPNTLRKKQRLSPKPLSRELNAYLAYSQETCTKRNAPFNAARIRRFEAYLAEHDLHVVHAELNDINQFLAWITKTKGPEISKGFESNLLEFYQALIHQGIMTINPLKVQNQNTLVPIDTEALSAELKAFVTYQESFGLFDSLKFDIRRIQSWELFLQQKGQSVLLATKQDVVDFMADADKKFTPKQSCGLALTIQDFYAALINLGMMDHDKTFPNHFAQYQDTLELIIHSEEVSQTADKGLKELRHEVQKTRNWRIILLVTITLLLGFSGFLAYQLLSYEPLQTTTIGTTQPNDPNAEVIQYVAKPLDPSQLAPLYETSPSSPNPTVPTTNTPITPRQPIIQPATPIKPKAPAAHTPLSVIPMSTESALANEKNQGATPSETATPKQVKPITTSTQPDIKPDVKPDVSQSLPKISTPQLVTPTPDSIGQEAVPTEPVTWPVTVEEKTITDQVTNTLPEVPRAKSPLQPVAQPTAEPQIADEMTDKLPEAPRSQSQPAAVAQPKQEPQDKACIAGNCRNGIGTFVHPDGAKYRGGWKNGKMDGEGEFLLSTGGRYRGVWKNGRLTVLNY